MITQKLKVNLIPSGIAPRVNVSQYDYGSRTLEISLYNGTEPFMIPENANIFIQGTKKDGRGFQYEGLAYDDNVVTADITQQMTVFEDEVVTELVILVGEEQLATANFILNVEPAALRDDVVVSETDIPAIQNLPEAMAEVRAAVISTAADALAASGSATAAANSADSASGSATAASGSATAAGNSADDAEAWAVGKIDGVDVPSTDPRHNNNAKHYSDTASGYSTSAAQSATAAAASELHAGTSETNAHTSEVNAAGSATSANSDAKLSESWAVGGTGTRSGEDTNNAKYWAEQAASSAGGHFVSYDQQTLTPAQKTQARENIGATNGLANANDTQFYNLQDGDGVIWSSQLNKFVNGEVGMRIVQIPQPKTVQGQPKEYIYDGTQQTFEWDSIDSAHILLQNENQVNAGNYNVIASLKGSGDLWTDMTNAPKSFAWTIAKAQGSFSLSANSASVDINNPTATINVSNVVGDGVISVASSDDNVATASISNGVITITGVATGTATITVTMADGTNYLGDSHTISVTATYTTQISLVVNGAKGDNIIVTDENGNQTDFSPIAFDTNATSKTVIAEIPSNGAEYKFASANIDHWDGTADKAEKVIKLDPQNTTADVMPVGINYYYRGNELVNLSLSPLNIGTLTKNADNASLNMTSGGDNAFAQFSRQINYDSDFDRVKVMSKWRKNAGYNSSYSSVGYATVSNLNGESSTYWKHIINLSSDRAEGEIKVASLKKPSNVTGNRYPGFYAYQDINDLYALWFESKRSLPVGDTMNVTITIEGAKEDKITIYDKYGEVVDYVDFATGATSATVTLAIRTGGEKLKFVSSVAKDTTDTTKNYYKWVDVDDETTNVVLIPNGALLWYDNNVGSMAAINIKQNSSHNELGTITVASGTVYTSVLLSRPLNVGDVCSNGYFSGHKINLANYSKAVIRTDSEITISGVAANTYSKMFLAYSTLDEPNGIYNATSWGAEAVIASDSVPSFNGDKELSLADVSVEAYIGITLANCYYSNSEARIIKNNVKAIWLVE